jgi:hypothetical protein
MNNDEFWTSVYSGKGDSTTPARISLVRLALLFGVGAAAIALIVPPVLHSQTRDRAYLAGQPGIDYRTTGSIDRGKRYSVRRSVLQDSVDAVCIIDVHGNRSGDC